MAADAIRDQAMNEHLGGEASKLWESRKLRLRSWGGIEGRAMRMKDRALMWVYVIEWCAVSGPGILCPLRPAD